MIVFNADMLFVHNPKTAGTSLIHYFQQALASAAPNTIGLPLLRRFTRSQPRQVFTAGVEELGTHHPHLSLAVGYACALTQTRPADFKAIVSVLRDPYDREISMYSYFRDVLCSSSSRTADLNDARMEEAVLMAGQLEFPAYIEWLWNAWGTCDLWRSRYYYETSAGERPGNLVLLRFEHLATDLAAMSERLGLQSAPIHRHNVSRREAAHAYYDQRSLKRVTDSYQWMFEAGHYHPLTTPNEK